MTDDATTPNADDASDATVDAVAGPFDVHRHFVMGFYLGHEFGNGDDLLIRQRSNIGILRRLFLDPTTCFTDKNMILVSQLLLNDLMAHFVDHKVIRSYYSRHNRFPQTEVAVYDGFVVTVVVWIEREGYATHF